MPQPYANFKFPPGFSKNALVEANATYYVVNRKAPRGKVGTVVAATSKPNSLRVLWSDCRYDAEVDIRCLTVLRQGAVA